jgi:hypothetical protein
MEPPINLKSIQAITTSFPFDGPTAVLMASYKPVFLCASFKRSIYFLESSNFKKSFDFNLMSSSLNWLLSNRISKYSLLPI